MKKFCRPDLSTQFFAKTAGLAVALGLAGCAAQTPKYDSQTGDALQRAKQAQTVLPTPAQRRTPAPAVTSAEVQRAVNSASSGQIPSMSPGSSIGGSSGGSSGSSSGSTSTVSR